MANLYSDEDWERLVGMAWPHGLDLTAYKRGQIERRVSGLMGLEGFREVKAFVRVAMQDGLLYQRFHSYLTIHVTEFFRDPSYWTRFGQIVEETTRESSKVWSVGCSWGAEPVTIALILESFGRSYDILATDSDDLVLEEARRGTYSMEAIAQVPEPYRRYFRPTTEGFKVGHLERGVIRYLRHNLLIDPISGSFGIIVCRNLLIYFERETRARLVQRLTEVLEPGGVLFLGATESLLEYRSLGFQLIAPSIYQKVIGIDKAKRA